MPDLALLKDAFRKSLQVQTRTRKNGFALIIVIWIAGILGLMSAGAVKNVRVFLRETAGKVEGARAEALADSGITLAVMDLIAGRKSPTYARRFTSDNSPTACGVGNDQILVRIQDAGGRVNLNMAGVRLLQALFLGLGLDLDTASRYADTIIDFRDQDDDQRPAGAEKPAYLAAGRKWGPKNAQFDAVEELHQVLGLDPKTIAAMDAHVTVHSGMAGVDPKVITNKLSSILIDGQQHLPATNSQRGDVNGFPVEFLMSSSRRVFVINSEARLATGAVFVREAVIDFSLTQNVYRVFKSWKRGHIVVDGASEIDTEALTPC